MDDQRKAEIRALHAEATRTYDRAIMTLSSGALALSVTFVDTVLNRATVEWAPSLAVGWSALTVSLLTIVCSFATYEKALRLQYAEKPGADTWDRRTAILNLVAGIGLAVGLAGLAWFAFHNLEA